MVCVNALFNWDQQDSLERDNAIHMKVSWIIINQSVYLHILVNLIDLYT